MRHECLGPRGQNTRFEAPGTLLPRVMASRPALGWKKVGRGGFSESSGNVASCGLFAMCWHLRIVKEPCTTWPANARSYLRILTSGAGRTSVPKRNENWPLRRESNGRSRIAADAREASGRRSATALALHSIPRSFSSLCACDPRLRRLYQDQISEVCLLSKSACFSS